jgi:hypothetical protein
MAVISAIGKSANALMREHAPFCLVPAISEAGNQMSSRLRTVDMCQEAHFTSGLPAESSEGENVHADIVQKPQSSLM